MSKYILLDTAFAGSTKDNLIAEIIAQIPSGDVPQSVLDEIAGKVSKETGKSLIDDSLIEYVHEPGSDNQDLSSFITSSDPRLTDARTPTYHTHESPGGLTQAQILTRQL